MLARLVEFSLAQRLLVLVAAAVLAVAGVQAFRDLPVDAYPDVSSTQVKVIMKAPGMTPEEVEARITTPIEIELLGIPHKRVVRSVSKYALADVTVDFADGTDIYWARQQVAERLAAVAADLPPGTSGGLAPITTPLGEMFMFTVDGEGLSLAERRTLLDWTIRPALRTLPGVADVNVLGGEVRSFEVVPDNTAMQARGVTPAQLAQALGANNRNDGAGRVREGEETLLVRIEGGLRSLEDLRAVVVGAGGGAPVRVGDVAEVRVGSLTRYGAVTRDGRAEAVQGLVLGLRGANARAVVERVHQRLAELAPTLPRGVTTRVFYDRGALVDRATGTVARALAEAIVLVMVLLLFFLGDVRAALVVALTLPMAALGTFVLMRHTGMSANLMSLGGLAIAIGMLVDGAVVMVENAVSHLAAGAAGDRRARVAAAAREVAGPVVSGVAIIIVVFLPLLTLEGLEGKLFAPVALAIVYALGVSLLLSLTVVPVLASLMLRPAGHGEPWLVRQALRLYAPLLDMALARGNRFMAGAAVALAAAAGIYPLIGKTFMPALDEGDIIIGLEKLPSISLEESVATDLRLQRALLARVPEVQGVVARTGADEIGLDPMGLNQTDTFLTLKPKRDWRRDDKAWLVDRLREVLDGFPGLAYSFTQPIEMRVAEMLMGVRGDVAVKIYGPDLPTLNALARRLVEVLRAVDGAEDVLTVRNDGVQYLSVVVDRLAAGRLGLDVDTIAAALRTQVEGERVGLVLEGGRRTPLLIRGAESLRTSPAVLGAMNLTLPGGGSVPVSQVARVSRVEGPVKVDHENAARLVVVQANVRGRDLVGFAAEAQRAAAALALPEGYRMAWSGEFENQQRAAARLAVVVPVALALIFVLLFLTFGSLRQSLLILANIPFALIGGVMALAVAREYLSVPASVGFIALLGIAVLNGVVMVSCFNQYLAAGSRLRDAVVQGARRRLRPVLMTAGITAFGLVPLLVATGPGAEIQRPLAIVVVGGLATSTLLTLLLLPVLFMRYGVAPAARAELS
ncbi:MAG: efflux RND transporter permease subunit [Burkholderiales bacterium]|nr:efflux RND transporter permease subunit [Burkholderiales bacterium]